jgi:hypothetical protein
LTVERASTPLINNNVKEFQEEEEKKPKLFAFVGVILFLELFVELLLVVVPF